MRRWRNFVTASSRKTPLLNFSSGTRQIPTLSWTTSCWTAPPWRSSSPRGPSRGRRRAERRVLKRTAPHRRRGQGRGRGPPRDPPPRRPPAPSASVTPPTSVRGRGCSTSTQPSMSSGAMYPPSRMRSVSPRSTRCGWPLPTSLSSARSSSLGAILNLTWSGA